MDLGLSKVTSKASDFLGANSLGSNSNCLLLQTNFLTSLLLASRFNWLGDFLLPLDRGVGGARAPPDAPVPGDFLLAQGSCVAGDLQPEGWEAGVLQSEGGEAGVLQ